MTMQAAEASWTLIQLLALVVCVAIMMRAK
jgi:hypothetical protein